MHVAEGAGTRVQIYWRESVEAIELKEQQYLEID